MGSLIGRSNFGLPRERSRPAHCEGRIVRRLPVAAASCLARIARLGAVAVLSACVMSPPAAAAGQAEITTATEAADLGDLTRFASSIVRIDTRAIDGASTAAALGNRRSGSGVIVAPQLVLTVGYLLLEAEDVEITTPDGRQSPGSVAAYDPGTGLALVRTLVPIPGQPLTLGDSDTVDVNSPVLTQGHDEAQATELLVSSRKVFAASWEYLVDRAIFTFPPVNNWSGSALLSLDGKLVGIGSLIVSDAGDDGQRMPGNMFVPVNALKPILQDLIAHGHRTDRPPPPWLGMNTEMIRGNLMVVRVASQGPAEQAGIRPGDIVVAVGTTRVHDQVAFYRQLWSSGPAGADIELQVFKEGRVQSIRIHSIDRIDALRKPRGI